MSMVRDVVIRAEGLGKKYQLRHRAEGERYVALRDVMIRGLGGMWQKAAGIVRGHTIVSGGAVEEFWALKDVSFEVRRGEVLGIVGRNGAGKSTLLKILSRITEPSEGRVMIKGRVASLLEVGTGFHPELTGRENLFLNGAILGMTSAEVRLKFDEIVAFAEVEKFLDTPVKRYSSGMYVRLAFAIAAHLQPDILIVDEVLAVGDAEFQKKCLGKINDVANGGRTVLFVSHNIQALRSLCSRALLFRLGSIVLDDAVENVARFYLESARADQTRWSSVTGLGDDDVLLKALRIYPECGTSFSSSVPISIELVVDVQNAMHALCVGFDLIAEDGSVILRAYNTDDPREASYGKNPGIYRVVCTIEPGLLHGRRYQVAPRIGVHCQKWIVHCDPLVSADVDLDHGMTAYWTVVDAQTRPGLIAPIFQWRSDLITNEWQSLGKRLSDSLI
ncbi:MAG TPA: polysaccharide ABC transporter ATP-binding protein [Xanthobacteraceae bacterium]|nr:polysaccharide ABC transporter ATP-binding protein [Xanthobacteraceae bacterium]